MLSATNWMSVLAMIHPHTLPAGPLYARLYVKVEAIEGRMPRMENDTEKHDQIEKSRLNLREVLFSACLQTRKAYTHRTLIS